MAEPSVPSIRDNPDGVQVFLRSLALVGVAELFDKTWFMGLLLAMRYNVFTVFAGSFTALFLHTVLAACFGYAFARFLSLVVLNFTAAALFLLFTILYAKDCYTADPNSDAIAAGKEEAGKGYSTSDEDEEQESEGQGCGRTSDTWFCQNWSVFGKAFMCVFIAEWGDRTQIAMIGQHASQPLLPVFLGSVVAFFFLTVSAVGCASVASTQNCLTERLVHGIGALSFAVFAIFALRDGWAALIAQQPEQKQQL